MSSIKYEDVLVVILARFDSKRLPGKVFEKIGDLPSIIHCCERVRCAGIPWTIASPDSRVVNRCKMMGYPSVIGPLDPLQRLKYIARLQGPKIIVRVTADDVLVEPRFISELLDAHIESGEYERTFSSDIPRGFDCDVYTSDSLFRFGTTEYIGNLEWEQQDIPYPQYRGLGLPNLELNTTDDLEELRNLIEAHESNELVGIDDTIKYYNLMKSFKEETESIIKDL